MVFFTYDDPPAPQEPPQHHTPLSPRRSRAIFSHRPSPSSDSSKSSTRTSTPVPPHISRSLSTSRIKSVSPPQTPDGSLNAQSRPNTISDEDARHAPHPDGPVTRDKSGRAGSISDSPADSSSSAVSETHKLGLRVHVSAQKNKPAPTLYGTLEAIPPEHKKHSSRTTTTTQRPRSNPTNPTGKGVGLSQTQIARLKSNSMMGRDSEHDTRSMISSLLDAYCRSDTDEVSGEDYLWSDDRSTVFSDDTISLSSVMDSPKSSFSDVLRPYMAASNTPQKHRKPSSLLISTSPSDWQRDSMALELPASPQTAPPARHPRPLPPVPASQRPVRPLPQPPLPPPPYTSPVNCGFPPMPSIELSLSRTSTSSSTSSSPSSSNDTSFSSESPISSPSSIKLELDTLATQPKISKRPFLGAALTIPPLSSGPPSPLTPDIPIPPSPMTAKRHQASKLSKMLGEEITPELLCDRQGAARPPPQNHHTGTGARILISNRRKQVTVPEAAVYIPGGTMTATTPTPTFRDTQTLTVGRRTRNARPQAIYVQDSTSEDLGHANSVGREEECGSDTESERSTCSDEQIGFKLRITAGEELQDMEQPSPASSRKVDPVVMSPTDSMLEDGLDDMEEAHIGWALQNVITYGTASRVKRTSRTWVVERNGQRWEEQNYDNVLKALRQL